MEAGVVYLQSEQHEFRVKENGRVWTVYGSPVRLRLLENTESYSVSTVVACLL